MTEDFDAKLSYGSNSLGSIVTLFREGIQGDGGWMASIKGAGGTCPSRNNGGGLIQVRWSFVAILLSQLYLKRGQAKRWGKMVFSFRRKEGRVFFSCVGRGESGWRRVVKLVLDKEGKL